MPAAPRFALLVALVALAAAPAAGAQEPTPTTPPPADPDQKVIAPGVKAGGVDVGGQTIESAATNLELALRPAIDKVATVASAERQFRLPAADAKVRFDALRTAKRAYYAGRDHGPGVEVPLALTHSRKAVAAFAERVDEKVARRPRNARVRITLTQLFLRKGKRGRTINEHELARRMNRAYRDLSRRRAFRAPTKPDLPDVTTAEARRQHRTVLTVDRRGYKLRLFKRLRHRKTYDIAIGMAGYGTPGGRFTIQSRQVNPVWNVPNSAWAGSLAGQRIPGGAPNNPLKARWLGVSGSVGIHGTAEDWSIGTRASHGCIRMRVSDVIDLYPRVPLGTPVLIR